MTDKKNGKADKSRQTQAKILQAVLDIIVDQGMRGVHQRAVAKLAGVSLGTTTYHFSSLEQLISAAFNFWHYQGELGATPLYQDIQQTLMPFIGIAIKQIDKIPLINDLTELATRYIRDQTGTHQKDRIIELAFYHESLRCEQLQQLLIAYWQSELNELEKLLKALGSQRYKEDAAITFALIQQLEQSSVILGPEQSISVNIEQTLRHHISGLIL